MAVTSANSLISPPVSSRTPLGSLSGWSLVQHCPKCGERARPVNQIATSPALSAKPLIDVLSRMTCSICGAKPLKLEAECTWAARFLPQKTRIDLSWLLPVAE